ncbi:MAG: hypothetical protein AAF598_19640 [Bacteroidota bacterium]
MRLSDQQIGTSSKTKIVEIELNYPAESTDSSFDLTEGKKMTGPAFAQPVYKNKKFNSLLEAISKIPFDLQVDLILPNVVVKSLR